MVDSRQKGARGESAAKKILIDETGLNWQRTPGSGALNKNHMLKGDLYIPDCSNKFCIEVKNYADTQFNTKIFTDKEPQLLKWWEQTLRQANQVSREPLLLFKFDRSKFFVVFRSLALPGSFMANMKKPKDTYRHVKYYFNTNDANPTWGTMPIYIAKLSDWLEEENIVWTL